jgi:hypothetical protein
LTKVDDPTKNYETINIFDDNVEHTTEELPTVAELIQEMLDANIAQDNLPVGLTNLNTENSATLVTPL